LDGSLVVADGGNQTIWRVDPLTGDRVVLSSNFVGIGTNFVEPLGIAVVPSTIPEPSTALLLGFGLVGLGVRRKRLN
jgi:hypothetical protein